MQMIFLHSGFSWLLCDTKKPAPFVCAFDISVETLPIFFARPFLILSILIAASNFLHSYVNLKRI